MPEGGEKHRKDDLPDDAVIHGVYGEKLGSFDKNDFSWLGGNDYDISGQYDQPVGGISKNSFTWLTGGDDYDLVGRYGGKIGGVSRDPFSWFTGNDFIISGKYGEKVGNIYRNKFSWLTGGDDYIITGKYGEKIGGFSKDPWAGIEEGMASIAAGVIIIGVILAIVITILIITAPIFLGRKFAREWGPPWDAFSLTTLMYLIYAMIGFTAAAAQPQGFAQSTAEWQAQIQVTAQLLYWTTTSFSLLLTWKMTQALTGCRDAWSFPAPTARLLPLLLGTGFSVNGLFWLAFAVIPSANGAVWGAIYANSLARWFITTWDVGGWVAHFQPGMGGDASWWHAAAPAFGGADLGAAGLCFLGAWLWNRLSPARPLPAVVA